MPRPRSSRHRQRRPRGSSIVPRDGAAQSELRIGHLSARRDTPDYPALLVMNAVMGGQFVSRINLKLREEKGYTYGARTGFDWRRGPAPFSCRRACTRRATADAVRDSLDELDAIRGSRPPSESELTLAKASLTRGYPRNFETGAAGGALGRPAGALRICRMPISRSSCPKVQRRLGGRTSARAAERYIDPAKLADAHRRRSRRISRIARSSGWASRTSCLSRSNRLMKNRQPDLQVVAFFSNVLTAWYSEAVSGCSYVNRRRCANHGH